MDDLRKLRAIVMVYANAENEYYKNFKKVLDRNRTFICQFCADKIDKRSDGTRACSKCNYFSCESCLEEKRINACEYCKKWICKKCSPKFGSCLYCESPVCGLCINKQQEKRDIDEFLKGVMCSACEKKSCNICHIPIDERIVCIIEDPEDDSGAGLITKNICLQCKKNSKLVFCTTCGNIVSERPKDIKELTEDDIYYNLCTICSANIVCEPCKNRLGISICEDCIESKLVMIREQKIQVLTFKNKNKSDWFDKAADYDLEDFDYSSEDFGDIVDEL